MTHIATPATDGGPAVLAATAAALAANAGAIPESAAAIVRLWADEARARTTVGGDGAALSLEASVDGTELVLALRDGGEPVSGAPAGVLGLVGLGMATSVEARIDGTGNLTTVRLALPAHSRLLDDAEIEVLSEEVALSDGAVEIRRLRPEDAAALTRCVYRCYGWTYPYAEMYYPERLAAAIEAGKRFGSVAVTPDGEVVTHIGAVVIADGLVIAGGGVTDPRYRRRGLLREAGAMFGEDVLEYGVRAYVSEPVLTHAATQHMTLQGNSFFMGMYLNVRGPLQQVDITDGMLDRRSSLFVGYQTVEPLEPDVLWVPGPYQAIARRVLAPTGWPLEIGEVHGSPEIPPTSVVESSFDALNSVGVVEVPVVGADLIERVDDAVAQLARSGAEMVKVYLPAGQPATAVVGAGLGVLRLGYAALLPRFGDLGHALVLQWVRDPHVDDSEWVYADDSLRELSNAIRAQADEFGTADDVRRRREARRQQLLAALPDAPDA